MSTDLEHQTNPAVNEPISDADFTFIASHEEIRDEKMKTKPTTFFKDAMKRFVKNRSSVVASVILFTLIAMAIIVPLADNNNIDSPNAAVQYLPPKWFGVNGAHFMDGTGEVTGEVLDPVTRQFGSQSTYRMNAVIGEMKIEETKTDRTTPSVLNYGAGGDIRLQASSINHEAGFMSQPYNVDLTKKISYSITLNKAMMEQENKVVPEYYIAYDFMYEGDEKVVKLASANENLDKLSVEDSAAAFMASEFYQGLTAAQQSDLAADFKPSFLIGLTAWDEEADPAIALNAIYVTSTSYTCEDAEYKDADAMVFTDATRAIKHILEKTKDADNKDIGYRALPTYSSVGLSQSSVLFASFTYDFYEGAFGEAPKDFSTKDYEKYINKGYMTLNIAGLVVGDNVPFDENSGTFALTELGEKYCPIRSIISYTKKSTKYGDVVTLTAECSYYRFYYDEGIIASCEMPKYFFGTNKQGKDFFKLVFAGLLSSLALGLMSAAINIFVGLIWGALSGYFGGVTDLVMERVTEILGGMPWVVLMTLVILHLGSNSWTFLLALCLTGWIGTASLTRSQFYRYKGREYVLASRTLGASDFRLIFRHILPNAIGTIVTSSVLMIPSVIFTEANIAYLLPNLYSSSTYSFGLALQAAQSDIQNYPYLIISSSIVMMLIMISFNLFGNGLRDAFNPSLKGTEE